MAEALVRIEECARGRARRLERAVIMHGTSRAREEGARLLSKIVQQSGAQGAAFGWTDELGPELLAPVHAVTAAPDVSWDTSLSPTLSMLIDRSDMFSWKLIVRGDDATRWDRIAALVSFTAGWFADAERRDCPDLHDAMLDGPCTGFIALLDAYRSVGFRIGSAHNVPFFQGEFRSEITQLPTAVRPAAEAVVEAIADHHVLPTALLEFGAALDTCGALPEAVSVHVIGYELALLRCDANSGADAARWAGRAYRKLADWSEAFRWYGLARRIAEFEEDWGRLAIVLDGTGNTHRELGAFPAARACYEDAWSVALVSQDPVAIGNVGHSMMTVEREAGNLHEATRFGWTSITAQPDLELRSRLLIDFGTLLVELGDLEAARQAYVTSAAQTSDVDIVTLATDALAYIDALLGDWRNYEAHRRAARMSARLASPHVRAQVGYYRGLSLLLSNRTSAASRVLEACERLARRAGLATWSVRAGELREAIARQEPPPSVQPRQAPIEVRRGLVEMVAQVEA